MAACGSLCPRTHRRVPTEAQVIQLNVLHLMSKVIAEQSHFDANEISMGEPIHGWAIPRTHGSPDADRLC